MWDRGYYYQHKRINGQPRRVYVGGGLLGEVAARKDAQRAAQDAQRRLERAADTEAQRAIDAQYRELRSSLAALLTAAGYYQHNREWRRMDLKAFAQRYREAEERAAAQAAGKLATAGGAGGVTAGDAPRPDVAAIVKRANGPKPSRADLDALRAVLEAQDGSGAIITVIDGSVILGGIIDKYTDSEASRAVMRADAERIGRTLGRDTAPPFERPLIDHIVTCWVRLQLVERDQAINTAGAHNRDSGLYWDRRLTEAQRRYLRAVNLLAKLRHLGPAVQVNMAAQMIVQNNGHD